MRKIILILMLLLAVEVYMAAEAFAQQGGTYEKYLTEGDSTFNVFLGSLRGSYKWCRATVWNPDSTLTDSARVYHVSKFDKPPKDSTYTAIGFKKLSIDTTLPQNDTVYYTAVLGPTESIEVLVFIPYPDGLFWDMFNTVYDATRALRIKNRFFNE